MKSDGTQLHKITVNNVTDRLASWSPDGEWVIFSSDVRSDGNLDIYRVRPDGSDLQVVCSSAERKSHARYSPDGRQIVFTRSSKTVGERSRRPAFDSATQANLSSVFIAW